MAKRKSRKARKARKQKLCPCPPSSAQIARKRAAKWCKANMDFKGEAKGAFLKCVSTMVSGWKKQKEAAKAAKDMEKKAKREAKKAAKKAENNPSGLLGGWFN